VAVEALRACSRAFDAVLDALFGSRDRHAA
jgi:hypothetical protein